MLQHVFVHRLIILTKFVLQCRVIYRLRLVWPGNLGNLLHLSRREVLNVIRSLNKEHSLTMIMVTHQMGFAREISDRVCFFNEGKIFEQGPPEKLFGDPQNDRTKQFLHAVLDAN